MSRSDFKTSTKEHQLVLFSQRGSLNSSLNQGVTDHLKAELGEFVSLWLNDDPCLEVSTSGSTGAPKIIKVLKEGMINSAVMTCSFLDLPKHSTALLCMPLKFIGAKMVVVRSMVASLELVAVEPSSHPLESLDFSPFFAAMTPAQVMNCFDNEHDLTILKGIKKLIIGGGAVSAELEEKLAMLDNEVYSTYGMTETLSHIALKQLRPVSTENYRLFDGVNVSLSDRNTLVINSRALGVYNLETNDIVELFRDRSFRVLGRTDNTINSGGIKIQIEVAERLLEKAFSFDFAFSFVPDAVLGQKAVLLCNCKDTDKIKAICRELLPKYWAPKHIFYTESIPKTQSGKIARASVMELACKLYRKSSECI